MLYQPRRHETLAAPAWNETQVRAVIEAIAHDTEQQWDQQTYWPIHPLDRDFPPPVPAYMALYTGTAGVIWALHYLYALLRGADRLSADQRQTLYQRTAQMLPNTAHIKGNVANWYPTVTRNWLLNLMLVQWCHGAPGMVTSLAQTYPVGLSEPLDALLLQAGEMTWQAGPLKKGTNLCHGTAGNGYAFLKLFNRTRDELWLARSQPPLPQPPGVAARRRWIV